MLTGDLCVHEWGEGTSVVLVHGSGGSGAGFRQLFQVPWMFRTRRSRVGTPTRAPHLRTQRFLAPDRQGYGENPSVEASDFEDGAASVADLLGDGAHLLGTSYGGVVALLAAARRPEAVLSLAVNEPPAFGLGRGNPAVEELAAKAKNVFDTKRDATPEEFAAAFMAVIGAPPPLSPWMKQPNTISVPRWQNAGRVKPRSRWRNWLPRPSLSW